MQFVLVVKLINLNCKRARFTNYKFLHCQYGKKIFYKELKNITMITKYNLFTVNKWIFTTLKSILY